MLAPVAAAVLACSHFSCANWLGGTSSWFIHSRVALTTCVPAMASPTAASAMPYPDHDPPTISGPDCTSGQVPSGWLFPAPLAIAPSRCRQVIVCVPARARPGVRAPVDQDYIPRYLLSNTRAAGLSMASRARPYYQMIGYIE